jgi:UDP-glucose 4-epimerase
MSKILLTGGTGYIGSHVLVELLQLNHDVVVVDNLSNSSQESLNRVEKITGKKAKFYNVDLRDEEALEKVFEENKIESIIHFAALKAVDVSVAKPLLYYENNISGSIVLFKLIQKYGIKNFVYSSSATVYGDPDKVPITEEFPVKATNPYGQTKVMTEQILRDMFVAFKFPNVALLRYFNPVGAHKSGLIGEDPEGVPANLVPFIAKVAVGKIPKLKVFGNDYDTPDGTCIRDYIHVSDLAIGHIRALEKLEKDQGVFTYNLGTGKGYSVLDVLKAFEKACAKEIPFEFAPRRPGDSVRVYADVTLANNELAWKAERDIDEMCEDVWRWQSGNPNGYKKQ